MITLGVTGGIGSGKSLVARMFAEEGARVFDADHEAKRIMQQDPAVRSELIAQFGSDAYLEGGTLNRGYLASIAFPDPERLAQLNEIVHPRVFASFERARRKAQEEGVEILVHEAALIFEAGGEKHMDAVVVVDASEDVRIQRVVERDGVTPESVRARMRHQLPAEELVRRADYVLRNEGTVEELRRQVARLLSELRRTQQPG